MPSARSARKRLALGRGEVADRAAEEGDHAAAAPGQLAEVALEVADHGVHVDAGYSALMARPRPAAWSR